ncbi:MAG: PAS domain-containing protein [Anaerolineae bacterium]
MPARESAPEPRELADVIQDYILCYDRQHRHVYANQAALDVTGLSRDAFIGKTHRELGFPEHLCTLWESGIDRVFSTGEPQTEVFEWVSPNGPVVLDWRVVPEFVDGKVVTALAVSRDITAVMQSQRLLLAQQAELDAIYENAPLIMLLLDGDGRVRRANRFAQALAAGSDIPGGQFRVGDMLGCRWALEGPGGCGSAPACAACAARLAVHTTLESGLSSEQIVASLPLSVDGQMHDRHFSVSSTPINIGAERMALVNVVDITSGVQAEAALRTSQALMEETQRLASVGGWQLDVLTGDVAWTSEVYRIHELPPDISPSLVDALSFYPEPDRGILEQALGRTVASGEPYDLECRFVTASGRSLFVRTIGAAEWQDGEVVRLIGAFQDITERKQAELALQRTHEELEARVEERTRELSHLNADLVALSETEQRLRRAAETLASASVSLGQSLSVEGRLQTLIDYLSASIPCDRIAVLLPIDEVTYAVRAVSDRGKDADPHPLLGVTVDARTVPPLQTVLSTGRALMLDDLGDLSSVYPLRVPGMCSWLGLPMITAGRVIGVCSLSRIEPGGYDADQVRLAEALVEQAASAVQNAWLFEQVRAGRERLEGFARRMVEVQEAERRYIARELHDQAAQALAALMMGLRMLERNAHKPEAVVAGVSELLGVAESVLDELRRLAVDLRPASLDYVGLSSALKQHLDAVGEQQGLATRVQVVGLEERLAPDTETALYRIVQEAVANIVRHARATRIDVSLERTGDAVMLAISNDGVGFEPETRPQKDYLGPLGMQERTDLLGGTLAIESLPGSGTTMRLEIPYGDTGTDR